MPFEPQPGEVVLFPAPFVPNEPQRLVISTKRVVQYAPQGIYPVAELAIEKIEHVGRLSERPNRVLGIVAAIVGLVFVIVFVAKVLPQVMYAGSQQSKTEAGAEGDGAAEEGIEGRDANDDDPFEKDKQHKDGAKEKAEKNLKKLKEVKFGWPGFTEDVIVGLLFLAGGLVALFVGSLLYKQERHLVFCRVGQIVYPLEVKDGMQQNAVLAMIQSAQQAGGQKK